MRGGGSGISPAAVGTEHGWFLRTIALWVRAVTSPDIDESRPEVGIRTVSRDAQGRGHIALRFPALPKDDPRLEQWRAKIQDLANQTLCGFPWSPIPAVFRTEIDAVKIQVEGNPWINAAGVCQDERCGGSNGFHTLDCCNPAKGGRSY